MFVPGALLVVSAVLLVGLIIFCCAAGTHSTMVVTGALQLLSAALLVGLIIWRLWHFSYFERQGIPGPKPNLIWGKLGEYHSKELYKCIGKWLDRYGEVFGFYNGDVRFVVLKDLNFIEYVYVSNLKNFVDRGMLPHIKEDSDIFVRSLEEYADSGKEMTYNSPYTTYARGLELEKDQTLYLVANANFLAAASGKGKLQYLLHLSVELHATPECTTTLGVLMKPLYWLSLVLGEYAFDGLNAHTAKVIQLRKNDPTLRKPDILQNLIDSEYIVAKNEGSDNGTREGSFERRALTVEEVTTSASVLFVAGFETTAVGLRYIIFALAKHPDVQEKLRREIIGAVGTNGSLDYETVMKRLKYLHYVVDEALRLYPPSLTCDAVTTFLRQIRFMTRQAKEDFEYNGKAFKAGTCFTAALRQIQIDPRYWTRPLEFIPERYAPENETPETKAANLAFGVGPRNCVGKRVALLKVRYTVARLLQRYRFELGPSQMGSMELGQYAMVSTPSRGPSILIHSLEEQPSES